MFLHGVTPKHHFHIHLCDDVRCSAGEANQPQLLVVLSDLNLISWLEYLYNSLR